MTEERPVFYYVDPTEEIASVLRGVKQAQVQRVAVVLPKEPRLFRNDINLRLISAYAREGGKEVALITTDRTVAKLAVPHGLRVYESPEMAWLPEGQVISNEITEPYPVVRPRTQAGKPVHKQRIGVVLVAVCAVAGLLFAFTPRVTVVVTPAIHKLERQLAVPLTAESGSTDGVALHVVETRVEAKAAAAATGRRLEGVAMAYGTVVFINDTAKQVDVPAGTIVATEGSQQFTTQKAVRVPPVKAEYFAGVVVGMQAGRAETSVKAVRPGSSGNVRSERVTVLPNGPKGLKVTNPEAFRGGTDRTVTYVTDDDIAAARKKALALLHAEAAKAAGSQAGSGSLVIESLLEVQEGPVGIAPTVGQEGTQVTVSLVGYVRAPYVVKKDVVVAVTGPADALVPAGSKRLGAPEVVGMEVAVPAGTKAQPESLVVQVNIPVGNGVDPAATARLITGMAPQEAKQMLTSSNEIGNVTIIQGAERKRLPRWTPWIRVVVDDTPSVALP